MTPSPRLANDDGMLTSTFLIPNLHCPSCVSNIEAALNDFSPQATLQNISLIDHAVVVAHSSSLLASTISNTFSQSGYEVFDVILDPTSKERQDSDQGDVEHSAPGLDHAINRWLPHHLEVDEEAKRLHAEHCSLCKAETEMETTKSSALISVTAKDPDCTLRPFKATFSIEGMTCSACVGNVTDAMKALSWVTSANVNLIDHSASVTFTSEQGSDSADIIAEAVEDVGYGASVVNVEEVKPQSSPANEQKSDLWKASISIGGMTCSSCVGAVTDALKKLSFVKAVDVNLVSHAGTVEFEGKEHAEDLVEAIDDAGYDAEINEVHELHKEKDQEKKKTRTVALKIDGMHCSHCPSRVEKALAELSVQVTNPPTLKDPIVKLVYQPSPVDLTIRTLISKLTEVDPAFSVGVYHPPSLEEKSRRMMSRERRRIFLRVLLSAIAAIPTLIIGVVYMNLVSHQNSSYEYLMHQLAGVSRAEWATFIMATPVYLFAADIFHRRTLKELYSLWRPGSKVPILRRFYKFGSMNMLISFGTTIAYFASLAELIITATGNGEPSEDGTREIYFDSVVFLTFFLLLGRLAEAHMKAKSGDAVAALGSLRPTQANLVTSKSSESRDELETVGLDLIDIGDVVKVFNGASPPCDGTIVDGATQFDESSLTGESKMISKSVGDQVLSGTINKASPVSVRVTDIAGSSMLDSIIQVVREGQAKRAPVERVADMLTGYFVPVIVLLVIITWIVWLTLGVSGSLPKNYLDSKSGSWSVWSLQFAIAVFVIACPCGLGLAAPTALFVGGGIAAKRGILVKGGGEAFQEASTLDCVVFDKTGTLTEGGEPKITDHHVYEESFLTEALILGVTLGLEENSSHPLANAVRVFVSGKSYEGTRVSSIDEIPGKGMKGSLCLSTNKSPDIEAIVGNQRLMTEHNVIVSSDAKELVSSWQSEGKSVIMVAARATNEASNKVAGDWKLYGLFAAADPLRPEAKPVVATLRKMNINVWMLSGDNQATAEAIAEQVDIPATNVIAGVLPEEKATKIKYLQSSLQKQNQENAVKEGTHAQRALVAMVGDGINDAPALAAADVGIAIGSGSDVALNSASFILINSDLNALLTLLQLSRAVFRRIKFNFGWAAVYNLVALPIAAGVLYPIRTSNGGHVRLDPVWAALAMALSSISVVGSSLMLRTRIWGVGFRERPL